MARREFSKVSPALWRSKRFMGMDSDARVAHVYLLTCEHQNSAGCFRLPDAYAAADLVCSLEDYVAIRTRLVDAGLISFNPETSEVYIDRWFKHCPPMNDKHGAGTMKLITEIESDAIREKVEGEFTAANVGRLAKGGPKRQERAF